MTSYKDSIRHRTCRLLVEEDRNLIDLYYFKHSKCAGVKCLQNEHSSFLFTKLDLSFSQHKKVASLRFGFFIFLMVCQTTLISIKLLNQERFIHLFIPDISTAPHRNYH